MARSVYSAPSDNNWRPDRAQAEASPANERVERPLDFGALAQTFGAAVLEDAFPDLVDCQPDLPNPCPQ